MLVETACLKLHGICAGQKAAAYIPGTDANRESKDRQHEEGYRSTPGTGTGNGYGSATSGYGTGSSQNTSGTASMTTGEPELQQPSGVLTALKHTSWMGLATSAVLPASMQKRKQDVQIARKISYTNILTTHDANLYDKHGLIHAPSLIVLQTQTWSSSSHEKNAQEMSSTQRIDMTA